MKDPHGNKTISQRMKRLEKRNREKGLVRVQVWVPGSRRADIIKIAAMYREGAA